MTTNICLDVHHEMCNHSDTAHLESPVSQQGAEYTDSSAREIIILSASDKVEAGKAHLSWSVVNEEVYEGFSEREDVVQIDRVLDYIEQEILFENIEENITITLSTK